MATKFVAPVIALALLVITFSFGKPPGEKRLVFTAENLHRLMFTEEAS